MAKFNVTYERRFVQHESLTVQIEAKNATEARKIARAQMSDPAIVDADWDNDGGDYDQHSIDSIDSA
jgi:hypothetical protein